MHIARKACTSNVACVTSWIYNHVCSCPRHMRSWTKGYLNMTRIWQLELSRQTSLWLWVILLLVDLSLWLWVILLLVDLFASTLYMYRNITILCFCTTIPTSFFCFTSFLGYHFCFFVECFTILTCFFLVLLPSAHMCSEAMVVGFSVCLYIYISWCCLSVPKTYCLVALSFCILQYNINNLPLLHVCRAPPFLLHVQIRDAGVIVV